MILVFNSKIAICFVVKVKVKIKIEIKIKIKKCTMYHVPCTTMVVPRKKFRFRIFLIKSNVKYFTQ